MSEQILQQIVNATNQYLEGCITAEELANKVANILLGAGLIGGA